MKFKCTQLLIFFSFILIFPSLGQSIELLSDINPGISNGITNSSNIVGSINGKLIFMADDGVHGSELWCTDGTPQGTHMIKDCNVGPGSSGASEAIKFNGVLLLSIYDGILGSELWQTDGTANGTFLIKDIYPGSIGSINNFVKIFEKNGFIYFIANDGIHGEEIWMTDGSSAGTNLLYDINPGISNSNLLPSAFYIFNGNLYFSAFNLLNGNELWVTNGVSLGTHILKELNTGSSSSIDPAGIYFYPCANGFIYQGIDSAGGFSMNFTDGTYNGTIELCSMLNGHLGAYDNELVKINSKWLFTNRSSIYRVNEELWVTDGTISGTHLVKDIDNDTLTSSMDGLGYLGHDSLNLYFAANDGFHGLEIYKTDGTFGGTSLLKDINSGASGCGTDKIISINGTLYFSANDSLHGFELWKSDGTTAGTFLLKDINPGVLNGVLFDTLFTNNGFLYFLASEPNTGMELWRSDGSAFGTNLFCDITPGPVSTLSISSTSLKYLINSTLIEVTTSTLGQELFQIDFNSGSCSLLNDISPGIENGFLYWFTVPDSSGNYSDVKYSSNYLFLGKNSISNLEIWKTNGLPNSTNQVFDINPGLSGSSPQFIFRMQNKIILKAIVDTLGKELFVMNLDTLTGNIVDNHQKEFVIFPNPTTGLINIRNIRGKDCIERISLFNMLGEKVKEYANLCENKTYDEDEIKFYVEYHGIYLLKIRANSIEYLYKVIVQ